VEAFGSFECLVCHAPFSPTQPPTILHDILNLRFTLNGAMQEQQQGQLTKKGGISTTSGCKMKLLSRFKRLSFHWPKPPSPTFLAFCGCLPVLGIQLKTNFVYVKYINYIFKWLSRCWFRISLLFRFIFLGMSFICILSTCRLSGINALAGVAIYTLRRDKGAWLLGGVRKGNIRVVKVWKWGCMKVH